MSLRFYPVLACVLAVTACTTIPVGSLITMSRIDPMTTDLSALRVAVQFPGAVRPRAGGVRMNVVAKVSGEATAKTDYRLVEETGETLRGTDFSPVHPGHAVFAYRLSPTDAANFSALRTEVAAKKAQGKSASIGLGIDTREFCLAGPLPSGPILITTYLRTVETGGYIVMTQDVDLRRQPETAGEIDRLTPC